MLLDPMQTLAYTPGPWELVLFLFIILLLFGSKKLPDLARSVGRSLTEFKRGKDEVARELKEAAAEGKNAPETEKDKAKEEA